MRRIQSALFTSVILAYATFSLVSCTSGGRVKVEPWGESPDGDVRLYTLVNANGVTAKVTNYGAILTELHVPDRDGKHADVVLGFDNLDAYLTGHPYFGATTGRVANRIAGGKFDLDGTSYQLTTNNGPNNVNHLHGGTKGFDKRVWSAEAIAVANGTAVKLSYVSPDDEQGYPCSLTTHVLYTLTDADELRIDYSATTDKPTPVNLTHHSYFNLSGEGSGSILDHDLMIAADHYTPVDGTGIPLGELAPVKDTVMDFTKTTRIGSRFEALPPKGGDPGGYDHNYCLNNKGGKMALAATLYDAKSGRLMEILTTEPGIQLYTGNYLDGSLKGKSGNTYEKNSGICLETQHYPDSINQPAFPSVVLRPGETYSHSTVHRFTAK